MFWTIENNPGTLLTRLEHAVRAREIIRVEAGVRGVACNTNLIAKGAHMAIEATTCVYI